MVLATKTAEKYYPRTQNADRVPIQGGELLIGDKRPVHAPDGSILSDESSDSDSEEDVNEEEMNRFVSTKRKDIEPQAGKEDTPFLTQSEIDDRFRDFSSHIRNPLNYNATDCDLRTFLDENLRIIVVLKKSEQGRHIIESFQYSLSASIK
jgi:hypothetical protein